MGNRERAGILVPERFIPTPTTVSPQAQAFLSNPPPFEQTTMPELGDISGWRAHIDKTNRGMIAYFAQPRNLSPQNEKPAIRGAMTHGIVFDAPEAKELMDEHVNFMLAHMGTE